MPIPGGALADAIGCAPPRWPDDPASAAALMQQARQAQLLPLLAYRLKTSPVWPRLPETLQTELNRAYRQAASYHLLRVEDLGRLLAWLRRQGIEALVLKGAALAYTHYPDPATRPHTDVDLLLPQDSRTGVEAGLRAQGFNANITLGDTPLSTQRTYYRPDAHGQLHAYDLHWTLSNSPFISAQFSYPELRNRAVLLPALGGMTPAPADALIYACLHWAEHQRHGEQRLMWLYDLALLAGQMRPPAAQACIAQMRAKRLQALCQHALRAALALFPIPLAEPWRHWQAEAPPQEPSIALLGSSAFARLQLDWQALGTARARLHWLRGYLLPPVAYMQARYPGLQTWQLPGCYLGRLWNGLRKHRH